MGKGIGCSQIEQFRGLAVAVCIAMAHFKSTAGGKVAHSAAVKIIFVFAKKVANSWDLRQELAGSDEHGDLTHDSA